MYIYKEKLLHFVWITLSSCLQPERAGRRHSIGSRAGSQPPDSQLGINRQDYFVLENLVQRQRTEAMKTQGLELVRLLRVSAVTYTDNISYWNWLVYIPFVVYSTGTQIFQKSKSHLKTLDARKVT